MDLFEFDPDKIRKEEEASKEEKRRLNSLGSVVDSLSNRHSAGEFYLGTMNPRQNGGDSFRSQADDIESPIERKKKLLDLYRNSKQMKRDSELDDPDSEASRSMRDQFSKYLKRPIGDTLSANQLQEQFGKLSSYAQSKFDADQKRQTELAKLNSTPKKFSDGQSQAATYGTRAQDADGVLSSLITNGFDPASMSTGFQETEIGLPFTDATIGLPERWKSEEVKKYQQAKRDFILAKLRKESGAAIAQSELESEAEAFFPLPGDTPDVLKQKAKARQAVIAGLRAQAGGAWDKLAETRMNVPVGITEPPSPELKRSLASKSPNQEPAKPKISQEEALAELKRRKSMMAIQDGAR